MSLMAIGTYASYFEVQMPISAQTTMTTSMRSTSSYVTSTATTSTARPTGHFCTTVNALDESGRSYAPGAERSYKPYRPYRVNGEDEGENSEDPFMEPIGDTPWILFALLIAGYVVYRRRFARDTND